MINLLLNLILNYYLKKLLVDIKMYHLLVNLDKVEVNYLLMLIFCFIKRKKKLKKEEKKIKIKNKII